MDNRLGMVFVVCAPSGAGKSTLIGKLRAEFPGMEFSVSHTTRAPRAGEVNGREYEFVSRGQFAARRDAGDYAEWAEVHGNFYGTPRAAVLDTLSRGLDVIFDVDVQGAAALRRAFDPAAFVFILPPSLEVLTARLAGRGTDDAQAVHKRLKNAEAEIARAGEFDYLVVNDVLSRAYEDLRAVYLAERLRPARNPGLAEAILASFSRPAR
ncbi:MAG: guanylate kinase [Desulfovibrionaceae bacterium]|nr:guanylate kinase [Desulfovibrionaceae bacterium]MBF0513343.1 guanylate kinase [Desulfovibrionaceae bacterium]